MEEPKRWLPFHSEAIAKVQNILYYLVYIPFNKDNRSCSTLTTLVYCT